MTSNIGELEKEGEIETAIGDEVSATLYLRGGAADPIQRRQAAVRGRFEAICEHGRIDDGRVERWARSVVTPVAAADAEAAAAVSVYRDLAAAVEAAGGRLQPFFEVAERRGGLLVGRTDGRRITFPACCLVVRRAETVTGVYPCWLDGTHHSVEDGLDAVAGGDPENLR